MVVYNSNYRAALYINTLWSLMDLSHYPRVARYYTRGVLLRTVTQYHTTKNTVIYLCHLGMVFLFRLLICGEVLLSSFVHRSKELGYGGLFLGVRARHLEENEHINAKSTCTVL